MVNREIGRSSSTFQKIKLLVGKNLILRRRHYIMTICEVFLPALFSFLMSYSRTEYEQVPAKIYETMTEEVLIQTLNRKCTEQEEMKHCTILFSPSSADCKNFMDKLISHLEDNKGILESGTSNVQAEINATGFEDESALTNHYEQHSLSTEDIILAGIIFGENCCSDVGRTSCDYTIRFPSGVLGETDKLYPSNPGPGKNCRGPNEVNVMRYSESGFTGLQILVEKMIVEKMTGIGFDQMNYSTIGFPYPEFDYMDLSQFYIVFLPQFVAQSSIFVVPSIIRNIVSEKESGIKELMKVMGLPSWMQWVGWAINSLLTTCLTVVMIVIVYWSSFKVNSVSAVGLIEPSIWLLVLSLYGVSATTFCFFITSFFQRSTMATGAGIFFWLLSYYAISIGLQDIDNLLATIVLTLLMPNVGLYYSLKLRSHFELSGGVVWSKIFESPQGWMSFGVICLIFLCSTFLYSVLIFYLDSVIPTRYSVPKPWNYMCQRKSLCSRKSETAESRLVELLRYFEPKREQHQCNRQTFQGVSSALIPGIEMFNISKRFSNSKLAAVENVTMTMYEGQITVLVGNNGAGKTTTISMLTGMMKPSRGIARVSGFDTCKEMDEIRKSLGYCPQHNLLFDNLTVLEHLCFFGKLKGKSHVEALSEANYYMETLQLTSKKNVFAKSLSGGQKRKLCLACALVGENKVLILDEPTSGLDPQARRAVWDILLLKRETTTIFITTHFLEEADILGDRVGIICDGKLKCFGSPWFLKKQFDAGYTLKLTTPGKGVSTSDILQLVHRHVSNASKMKQYATGTSELNINIPLKGNNKTFIQGLFTDLSCKKAELGIESIGLTQTTLEDVFLKVIDNSKYGCIDTELQSMDLKPYFENNGSNAYKSGCKAIAAKMWVLFLKRFLAATRRRGILFCQLLMPTILMATGILITRDIYQLGKAPGTLIIDPAAYNDPVALYSIQDEKLKEHFEEQCECGFQKCEESENKTLTETLLDIAENDLEAYRKHFIVAMNLSRSYNDNFTAAAMFSTIPIHSAPLAVNLASNAFLGAYEPSNTFRLRLTIHPLTTKMDLILESVKIFGIQAIQNSQVPVMYAGFISLGMGALVASFVVLPGEERLSRVKHIQLMTGIHPFIYWTSFYACDLIFIITSIGLMLGCVPILERGQTLRDNSGLGYLFVICLTYAFGAIPFTYLISLVVGSIPIGFALISTIHLLSGLAFNVFVSFLDVVDHKQAVMLNLFHWLARLFPTYSCVRSIIMFVSIGGSNMRCNVLSASGSLGPLCGHQNDTCCESCAGTDYSVCTPDADFLVWKTRTGEPGIGQELTYIVIMAFVYFGILIFVECRIWNCIRSSSSLKASETEIQRNTSDLSDPNIDGAVSTESKALIATQLTKTYKKLRAVSNLSVEIPYGQCFGLMGINGAGKSTLIRLLTGCQASTLGNAMCPLYDGPMLSLRTNRIEFLRRIGYCPQSEGIIPTLTGEEHLNLIATLRDVSSSEINDEVEKWLQLTGLGSARCIQAESYSGGMRRRLSIAMAFIGNPPIVILDEPTSGVDAHAKRQFWNVTAEATRTGQTVIITSHSLEEYEALCSNIGILVEGTLKCVGKIGEVRKKYTQGFELTVRTKHILPSDARLQEKLNDQILRSFDSSILTGSRQNLLEYQINMPSMCWSTFFKKMEGIRREYLLFVDEYSVNEVSLQHVLLSFSSDQNPLKH